jgi:hypothetical protein
LYDERSRSRSRGGSWAGARADLLLTAPGWGCGAAGLRRRRQPLTRRQEEVPRGGGALKVQGGEGGDGGEGGGGGGIGGGEGVEGGGDGWEGNGSRKVCLPSSGRLSHKDRGGFRDSGVDQSRLYGHPTAILRRCRGNHSSANQSRLNGRPTAISRRYRGNHLILGTQQGVR